MKTLTQLEELEKLHHATGLTGDALQAQWTATYTSSGIEPAMFDYKGGPIHEKYVPKK